MFPSSFSLPFDILGVLTVDVKIATLSDIGWVVSHSYTLYGPLLVGAATVLYEGTNISLTAMVAYGSARYEA